MTMKFIYVRTNAAAAAHAFLHKSLKVDRTTIALEEDQWYVHFTRGGNGQTMDKKERKYKFCLQIYVYVEPTSLGNSYTYFQITWKHQKIDYFVCSDWNKITTMYGNLKLILTWNIQNNICFVGFTNRLNLLLPLHLADPFREASNASFKIDGCSDTKLYNWNIPSSSIVKW